jgi:hypothetical protein
VRVSRRWALRVFLAGWPGIAAKRKELALLKINLINHVNFEERQLPTHDDDKASQKDLQCFF